MPAGPLTPAHRFWLKACSIKVQQPKRTLPTANDHYSLTASGTTFNDPAATGYALEGRILDPQ